MSVKVIAELNPTNTKRAEFAVSAKPIADIIAELNTGFALSQARVCRNGEIVTDFSRLAYDGDTLWIKFVPHGSPQQAGAGMKVGGYALTFLGIVISAVFGWTGVGGFIGSALIGTGLSMTLGGTVLLNINIPSIKDREKPENDPSIRGGKNQARPHGRIPVLFGRHRVYPDLAANPYTEIIDGKQYLTQLFCGGYRDCEIDLATLKLGDTSLLELSATGDIAQILSGADSIIRLEILQNGQPSNLYPHCVHEEAINAPLQNEVDGGDDQKISGEIVRTTPDKTDTINVDIFLYNGIGKYNDEGDLRSASVEVAAFYKKADDPDSAYQSLGFFNNGSNTLSGQELKTKRYQITKTGLIPGQYTVKIKRVTKDSTDSKVVDQVYIGSIRSIKSARPIRVERQRDLTVIAMRVLATSKLNNIVDSFNYIATSKLPVYSGGGSGALYWLTSATTRNPAATLLYALRGGAAQQIVAADDIDWESFERFYAWCEEREYACNAYLAESVTIAELLRMIGGAARADILRIDSKISVVQDIERPSPVQLFTPKNTKNYSVTMLSADIPDAISLRFIDEKAGFAQNELQLYNTPDGNRVMEPDTIQKCDLWGVTGSEQARRVGMYNYGCLKHRPFIHSIEVDIEYLLCNKGDWIQYAGDLALTGAAQGRVIEPLWSDGFCVGFRADEPVAMEAGKQYAARLRKPDGSVLLKTVSVIREPDEIYLVEPFAEDDAPRKGDIYAFGVRGQEKLDLIITDIQPQADLSATLTCVEHSPAIFAVDDPDFVLPEFENKITPVSGAVDSGVANPNQWKLFIVYHDADYEPPRPRGNGQSNGWHYAQTQRAVWQSDKMAEAIDSGEWGPPVRIKAERGDTDVNPIYLSLSPQNITLECDSDGNILTGLLPFASQAALYKWNYRIPSSSDKRYFTGTGGNQFDPALGDFYPSGPFIVFALADAPKGISISEDGLITVEADAALEDANSISVQARYLEETYSATLSIAIRKRAGESRYLGTIDTLPETAAITILKGPARGNARALQGNYVLAVASGYNWQAGRVYQWTGLAWEYREPQNHSDLYARCFADGLDAPELTQDMGWFGAVFAKLIIAQKAAIEELQTQVITLQQGGAIQSADFVENGNKGFRLKSDGDVEFNNGKFKGHIEAESGSFKGIIYANDGKFTGKIESGNLLTDYDPSSLIRLPATGNYSSTAFYSDVRRAVYTALGRDLTKDLIVTPDDSAFMFNGVIRKIKLIEFYGYYGPLPNIPFHVIFTLDNGSAIGRNFITHDRIGNELRWLQFGTGDMKIRLVGLGSAAVGAAGTVYFKPKEDGKYLMIT